jgi:uncharacterized protein
MKLAAIALALALIPLTAQAQSFNCRTASLPDEVLICQNPRLSRLDERMASLYFTLRNSLAGAERRELEADQRRWLNSRIACGRDYGCILAHYERRIRVLRDW